MRFISADSVHPISSVPISNGVIALEEDGRIAGVYESGSPHLPEAAQIEKHEGIICPGFVNAHCHLELSHLKGVLPERTGLAGFIGGVVAQRDTDMDKIHQAQKDADKSMWEAGVQAVGDICNTDHTLAVKKASKIWYHSFVEVLGAAPDRAEIMMQRAVALAERYMDEGLSASICPHALYSVSPALMRLITARAEAAGHAISMHNQETASEDEMFLSRSGLLFERLVALGVPLNDFLASGTSSLRTMLPCLPRYGRIMLVHNTFTSAADMAWAMERVEELFWCTCPSANQYIENTLPDVARWLHLGAAVCVGTDSLASNHQLSILEELKLLFERFPEIPFHQLLRMGTLNGAMALGTENRTGTLERSKIPGVLLLQGVDVGAPVISSKTTVTRLA